MHFIEYYLFLNDICCLLVVNKKDLAENNSFNVQKQR